MKNKFLRFVLLSAFLFSAAWQTKAEGISVDAGLTPAQDRIVVRLQYRNILNQMGDNDMVMHMMPVVVAYGLSPDITLMLRNGYRAVGTNETMMEMDNRWMDPFLMGKVKLYRHNTRVYSLGVAGFAGTTFPVLNSSVSKTYSPVMGINASFRPGLWSFDLNNAYEWVNYNMEENQSSARQLQLNLAVSRNILLPGIENWVLAPVQEFSFVRNNPATGESGSFGFISPGVQLVSPHVKFEGLYQIAINSSQPGIKNGNRLILGFRFMF
ncbi:hypothetical protein [Draconibacterium halophilum]|uniref:MetA-pathway of phenol degradation n=1 Tax=Draconibacterium halophilum TaxID=2706887 RepID=A0A6C0RES8_9BACT|nr:hypothetical protein [Draconibacterium halophilum]QIA08372.1 hypothetical protein G0Q07_11905 [Draconibacterium halophilum]